jgi:uncharacterized peroxidase-related enzyme
MMEAFRALNAAVFDPDGEVERGFKRLIAHIVSSAAGCRYCMAHTVGRAGHFGIAEDKVAAIWDYKTSPLYSEAERAALDVALAAGCVPNAVTDEMFMELRKHWSEGQIVEIVGTIALFGFSNRWNDTMATPLEDEPTEAGQKFLSGRGWSPGKHARSD